MQELFTEALYGKMKEAGRELNDETLPTEGIAGVIAKLKEEAREERESRKKAELLEREEEKRLLRLEETLQRYGAALAERRPESGPAAFDILRELFAGERERYEELLKEGSGMLEHAFDFLEAAFGNSQELVVFVTGLNRSEDALAFLRSCGCERYQQYNRSLLFGEGDREIRREIERLSTEG